MSSTLNRPTPARARTARITTFLFALTVVFFLLAGLVIVVGQIAALVAGDATAARHWAGTVAPFAFGGASAAGLLSFVLSYRRQEPDHD
ncbi:hypothetical protein [Goodfellowiella coeruleoviolacea]|uniref:Uncharacterized protein n=1 Tax=Goodfellowiella coeruleoviolacea TaxID=334858 RepID=A0AAE3GF64_9PSEU|nr:hypothetical protein [Goodfellowiella coeruleoviolacea]MCP2166593.1 hypothetical protein [Goodfellowiella coeruleoviolacea]